MANDERRLSNVHKWIAQSLSEIRQGLDEESVKKPYKVFGKMKPSDVGNAWATWILGLPEEDRERITMEGLKLFMARKEMDEVEGKKGHFVPTSMFPSESVVETSGNGFVPNTPKFGSSKSNDRSGDPSKKRGKGQSASSNPLSPVDSRPC